MKNRWIALLAAVIFVFSAGCSKERVPTKEQAPTSGEMPSGHMAMPMMKEDPRSIMSVEGVIEEIGPEQIVVHTKKDVHLKFKQDDKTAVMPAGKKLAMGMSVKIEIEHLARGMRAKAVQIE